MKAQPFSRWCGGKRQLLDRLVPMVPPRYSTYHEPFVGGGALFFELSPAKSFLADANVDLMHAYKQIRDNVEGLIRLLDDFPITEKNFYEVRAQSTENMSEVQRAARLIFLTKTCFNGVYRVNAAGGFNSPWGRWDAQRPNRLPPVCEPEKLRACSSALQRTVLFTGDFEEALLSAKEGAFIYLDPPYLPLTRTANFTGYTPGKFGEGDLLRLAVCCQRLSSRGARFMMSNADMPVVRKLFKQFRIDSVQARRALNCKKEKRGNVGEIVVRNYDDEGKILEQGATT